MRFSEFFEIDRTDADDWYDPHLTVDTKLFIDPLLLLLFGPPWESAHQELIEHFAHCFSLIAKAGSPSSTSGKMARRLLTFPEPAEFGLGYTTSGTRGSGSGDKFAGTIADGIAVAIAAGIDRPEHIEEIGILNEGIGADRISDAVANVLKHRFVSYTQSVCTSHSVPMALHRLTNARVFPAHGRWLNESVRLPTNPSSGGPILLAPDAILNNLPVLNADDWFDSNLNEDLRSQMNLKVGQHARKKDIVRFARANPDRVRAWARQQSSRPDLRGYDFADDPKGVVQWDGQPVAYARHHPLVGIHRPTDSDGLAILIGSALDSYAHFLEEQRGWSLLWDSDGKEKPEEAAQLVLLGMAKHYLGLFDVEIDREVEVGRGPVDFKASSGASLRALIEIKKAHNGKFWHGLQRQLPAYLKSDSCALGWYVALRYRSNRASAKRMAELPGMVRSASIRTSADLRYKSIDVRPRASASKDHE